MFRISAFRLTPSIALIFCCLPLPAGPADVIINEILYHPLREELREKFDAVNQGKYLEQGDDELGEYVELFNRGADAVDLSGWRFTSGIDFTFPDATFLAPGGFLVVAASREAMLARHGLGNVLGPFTGRLADGGERLALADRTGRVVQSVRYEDRHPWPIAPDEFGVSLEVIDPFSDNGSPANWRSSAARFQPPRPPVEAPDRGWQLVRRTGTATSNRLFIYLDQPGEWLIDDVRIIESGTQLNLVTNGSFEADDSGWNRNGNHSGSGRTDLDAHEGAASERLVASGPGDGTANNLEILRVRGMFPGREYTISFWARQLGGSSSLTMRLSGGGLLARASAIREFDLSADWSDSQNPGAAWSYLDGAGRAIAASIPQWLPGELGAGQPAWSAGGEAGGPAWARSTGSSASGPHSEHDFPAGAVAALGPAEARWVTPVEGLATIRGGLWLPRHPGSDQQWSLRIDGRIVAAGGLRAGGAQFSSSTPLPFESGADGPGALTTYLAAGSEIRLRVEPGPGAAPDLVAARLGIIFAAGEPVDPEPLPPPIGGAVGRGSPGRPNSALAAGVPPLVNGLRHLPEKPGSRDAVTVSAVVTGAVPIASVELEYFPGALAGGIRLPMADDGSHGDGAAGDGIYGVQVPAQANHTLVHYRVRALDARGGETVFPYADDPSPTQAYCHYDLEFGSRIAFYDFYVAPENIALLDADPYSDRYVDCSLAIDGVAYPHIGVRYRGRRSRVNPQHPWKFRFNKNQLYKGNRTLDTMYSVPFEQEVAFEIFDRAGIPNLEHELVRMHRNGQFWGLYIAFESPTGSWLEKHGLDAGGEVYKARTVETAGQAKNSDLFHNQIQTDLDYWGAWNKKIRPLEPPLHIRELTDKLNDLPPEELRPWLDARVDLDQWFRRWGLYILMNIDDFAGHNYYLFLPHSGDASKGFLKWQQLAYDLDSGLSFSRVGPLRALYGDGANGDSPAWQRNRFYQRVAADVSLKRIYFLTLRDLLENVIRLEELNPIIDAKFQEAAPERGLQSAKWGANTRPSTAEIKSVLAAQRSSMGKFLTAQKLPSPGDRPGCAPPGGEFNGAVTATLSAPGGRRIYYTLDGADPRLSPGRILYEGPFPIPASATLKAAGLGSGLEPASGDWTDLAAHVFNIHPPDNAVGPFLRGDCDGAGAIDLSDAILLLLHGFAGGAAPGCSAACDSNADGLLDPVADAIYILAYAYAGGSPPPAPFPDCKPGAAASDRALGCQVPPPCR